jgi:hypothetical protein
LEEHVVVAAPEDGAVGVVHPIFGGEEVELRAEGIGREIFFGGSVEEIFGVKG